MKSKLEELFYNGLSKNTNKWSNYFNIYQKHFDKFLNRSINLLEIGIAEGGSLELWYKYFGQDCNIFGIDIDPNVLNLKFEFPVDIAIGNQADEDFWKYYLFNKPNFDIIIDDGGHGMEEQITTLINVFPYLNNGGILLVEDVHTSYWAAFNGELLNQGTFIERSKSLVDFLNRQHIRSIQPNDTFVNIFKDLFSITFYNSVIVFEKQSYLPIVPVKNNKDY